MILKFEGIQKRAIKWILCEQGHHYNDYEYLMRLKDLDIMPMEYKFVYNDLVQFYKIYHGRSVVKLPQYLTQYTSNERFRLRANVKRPDQHSQSTISEIADLALMRSNRFDSSSLRCTIEAQSPVFKNSFFFRTHLRWNILPPYLKNANDTNDFTVKLKRHLWDVILDPH